MFLLFFCEDDTPPSVLQEIKSTEKVLMLKMVLKNNYSMSIFALTQRVINRVSSLMLLK
jgi:hypothetical protein